MSDAAASSPPTTVILLHGLGRSARSMRRMERALANEGYSTLNVDYPSTCHSVENLADRFVRPALEKARGASAGPAHFVTHSMGGILVRALAAQNLLHAKTRAVMLAPPHAGSELADRLRGRFPFSWWCGPALDELGTDTRSIPFNLPTRLSIEVGVIAGRYNQYAAVEPLLFRGAPPIPDTHDGVVSVRSAFSLNGLTDTLVVNRGHTFIMRASDVIRQTLHFLRVGRFKN